MALTKSIALSTTDNKYNPLTEYEKWKYEDEVVLGYYTESYLARILVTSEELGDEVVREDLERAIDEIVRLNLISTLYEGVSYIKVVGD